MNEGSGRRSRIGRCVGAECRVSLSACPVPACAPATSPAFCYNPLQAGNRPAWERRAEPQPRQQVGWLESRVPRLDPALRLAQVKPEPLRAGQPVGAVRVAAGRTVGDLQGAGGDVHDHRGQGFQDELVRLVFPVPADRFRPVLVIA